MLSKNLFSANDFLFTLKRSASFRLFDSKLSFDCCCEKCFPSVLSANLIDIFHSREFCMLRMGLKFIGERKHLNFTGKVFPLKITTSNQQRIEMGWTDRRAARETFCFFSDPSLGVCRSSESKPEFAAFTSTAISSIAEDPMICRHVSVGGSVDMCGDVD